MEGWMKGGEKGGRKWEGGEGGTEEEVEEGRTWGVMLMGIGFSPIWSGECQDYVGSESQIPYCLLLLFFSPHVLGPAPLIFFFPSLSFFLPPFTLCTFYKWSTFLPFLSFHPSATTSSFHLCPHFSYLFVFSPTNYLFIPSFSFILLFLPYSLPSFFPLEESPLHLSSNYLPLSFLLRPLLCYP